jgi:hypothetical protein
LKHQPVGCVERQRNLSSFAETRAVVGRIDVIDDKTQAALSQIGREEKLPPQIKFRR